MVRDTHMKTQFGYSYQDVAPKVYQKLPLVGIVSRYGKVVGDDPRPPPKAPYIKARELAQEAATEFIEALIAVYSDADYSRQVLAATRGPDSGHDKFEDKRRLATVRLGFESPVLERFGFSPTTLGQIRARSALVEAARTFPDLEEARAKMESLALPKESPGGDGEAGEMSVNADGATVELPHVVSLSNKRAPLFHPDGYPFCFLPGRRWLCTRGGSERGLEVSLGGECITVNFEEEVLEYLQPGSEVEEIYLTKSISDANRLRLRYKLITGKGPPQGWVDLRDTRGDGRDFMLPIEGPLPMPEGYVCEPASEPQQPEVATEVALPTQDHADAWVQQMMEAAAEVAPHMAQATDTLASMVRLKNKDGIEAALYQALAAGVQPEECCEAIEMVRSLQKTERVASDTLTKQELEASRNATSVKLELVFKRHHFEEAEGTSVPKDNMGKRREAKELCSVCSTPAPARDENIVNGRFMCSDCALIREKRIEEKKRRAFEKDVWLAAIKGPEYQALEAGEPEQAPEAQQLMLEAGAEPRAEARLEALEAESACIRAMEGRDIGGLAAAIDTGLAQCISDGVLRDARARLRALRAEAVGDESSRNALAVELLDALEQQCQAPEFQADLYVLRGAGGPSFTVGLGLLLTKQCMVAAATRKLGDGWTFDSAKSFLVEHAHSAGIAERLRVFERSLVHQDGDLFGKIAEPTGPAPPAEPPGPPPAEAKDDESEFHVVQLPETDMPAMPGEDKAKEREALEKELTRVRDDKVKAVMEEDFLRAHADQLLEKELAARLQALS